MIKEFKPKQEEEGFDESSLIALFRNGEINRAFKICKKFNVSIEKYSQEISDGIKKLIVSRRTGELLSCVFKYPELLSIDKIDILRKTFANGDYHGFLKNCFRFRIYSELREEIEIAMKRTRPEESLSWKRKFKQLNEI